ncbi:helix-turn-helix domain-containing protein [Sinomicrobium oceani]|uniref:helix-turn-helix domain-containing protein n=1 Tax=Sinomicrobium oceani TaxID=1150368 RepID=UPI00227C1B88|nr:helix-turn-helix domain-containing protein [Sinomicrobium oceani]
MKELGQKLKELRKKNGLSQEELADAAKVNLRTIQRIENNESVPRGKTLGLICEVLEINIEDILDFGKEENRKHLIYLHLSVLAFLAIPLGNIILPLILWLSKKDRIIGFKETGSNILNFQITWTILLGVTIMGHIFIVFRYGLRPEFLYFIMFLYVVNIILPIVFAFKSGYRRPAKMYPTILRLVK